MVKIPIAGASCVLDDLDVDSPKLSPRFTAVVNPHNFQEALRSLFSCTCWSSLYDTDGASSISSNPPLPTTPAPCFPVNPWSSGRLGSPSLHPPSGSSSVCVNLKAITAHGLKASRVVVILLPWSIHSPPTIIPRADLLQSCYTSGELPSTIFCHKQPRWLDFAIQLVRATLVPLAALSLYRSPQGRRVTGLASTICCIRGCGISQTSTLRVLQASRFLPTPIHPPYPPSSSISFPPSVNMCIWTTFNRRDIQQLAQRPQVFEGEGQVGFWERTFLYAGNRWKGRSMKRRSG
ncbi:hypothetical protein NMY22_g15955 [Coprinellus aureogranulatus]|nr:hypothetical protein NMY22_g15955 [Coprinellus aureogranulatus]